MWNLKFAQMPLCSTGNCMPYVPMPMHSANKGA